MKLRHVTTGVLLLALGGCQAAGQPYAAPGFVLTSLAGSVPVTPAAIPQAVGPQAQGDAALTVDVRSALPAAQRRLLAVIADVAKVTVRVQGAGVDQTLELTKAQLDAGTTSVTFANLPAGAYQVAIQALNASDAVIGSDFTSATVTAGQTTTVQATVKLTPTVASPRTLPSPTTGGNGGGSGPASGSLTTSVTLRDDIPVFTPTVLGTYAGPGYYSMGGAHLAADAEGHAWASWSPSEVARISPAGQVVVHTGLGAFDLERSVDGQRIYFPGASRTYTTLTGTLGPAVSGLQVGSYDVGAVAPDGTLYVGSYMANLQQIKPDGSTRTFLPRFVQEFEVDGAGDVWVAEFVRPTVMSAPTGVTITKHAPDGSVRFSRTLPYDGPAVDPASSYYSLDLELDGTGNAWVGLSQLGRMVRLKPDGEPLDTKALPAAGRLYADPLGRMWLNQGANVGRFDAAGELVAWYHVGQQVAPSEIAVTADDRLWVAAWMFGVIQLQLDPLPGP